MSNTYKVSVIVPIYKVEKYIHRCINSIINQTYENLEIILVDDGSPDNCGKIIDDYASKDSRIITIHQANGGQSKARNEAMKIATGDYYCFVDSDDYLNLNMIEKLVSLLLDNNTDISMINFCNFSGEEVSAGDLNATDSKEVLMSGYDCIRNMHEVHDEMYVVMWGKIFKKTLFEDITFPEGRICEDLAVLYRIFDKAESVVYSSEILYYYFRNNTNSSTFKINDKFYTDVFLALEEEIEYMKVNHPELVDFPRKTYLYWTFDYYRLLFKADVKSNATHLTELHNCFKSIYKIMSQKPQEKFYKAFYFAPKLYLTLKK